MDNAIGAPIKPHPDAEQFAACPLSLIICVEVDAQPPIRKITGASVSNEIFSMIVILVPVDCDVVVQFQANSTDG